MLYGVDPITCVDAILFEDDIVSAFMAAERLATVDFFGDCFCPARVLWSMVVFDDRFS